MLVDARLKGWGLVSVVYLQIKLHWENSSYKHYTNNKAFLENI